MDKLQSLWTKIQAQPPPPPSQQIVLQTTENAIFGAYFALLAMAVLPILVGSHASVPNHDAHDADEREVFTLSDAKSFPLFGSISLFTLYIVFTYLNKDYVNLLLTAYFALLGIGALFKSMLLLAEYALGKPIVANYKLSLFNLDNGTPHFGQLVALTLLRSTHPAFLNLTRRITVGFTRINSNLHCFQTLDPLKLPRSRLFHNGNSTPQPRLILDRLHPIVRFVLLRHFLGILHAGNGDSCKEF